MNRKIIDYIVVEILKPSVLQGSEYSFKDTGQELRTSLKLKKLEDEIAYLENTKKLHQEEIQYIEELLNTTEDFSTYKTLEDDIIFYQEKYSNSHPINNIIRYYDFYENIEDEHYRIELKKEIQILDRKIVAQNKKINVVVEKIHNLKIIKRAIVENSKNLNFETFRTDFENTVIYYLEKGYELQGGVSVAENESFYLVYSQAMVKYEF